MLNLKSSNTNETLSYRPRDLKFCETSNVHSSNNAIRQSNSPGRSVGQSPTYRRQSCRRRRHRAPRLARATNTVCHVVSRDFPLPNIYVRYAQPFGRGSCKEKKSDYDGKATAAQPGSALTKIAGGHLGEPPTSGLLLLRLFIVSRGGRRAAYRC